MTRTYTCNLCRVSVSNEKDPLIGLYWTTVSPIDQSYLGRERAIEKPDYDTENHICQKCLDDLMEIEAKRRARK